MPMAIDKITIPDFGDVQKITVVEVFIAPGDRVAKETSLISLESEKAVMDIPSPCSGLIKEVMVKEEDVVTSGDIIAIIETPDETAEEEQSSQSVADAEVSSASASEKSPEPVIPVQPVTHEKVIEEAEPTKKLDAGQGAHATPSVRAFAREQQVDLASITGRGPQGRILKEDILAALGQVADDLSRSPAVAEEPPLEDFSQYGEVEELTLSRIKKLAGAYLQRSWMTIPHVTHFSEADISELERFRKELNGSLSEEEPVYSPLVFVIRAVAATLKQFPLFNCSLMPGGEKVILKKYYHLGIAVDTPAGLVVPVIKDADQKGFAEIAAELKDLSSKARAGKLAINDFKGATFTISSLGGIDGSGFTPIVSTPQAAILGVSRSYIKPVWDGEQFVPTLTLPFSISYDHRIIDGAEAARFSKELRLNIEDLKRTLI
jgi:pyruvate dehydrogenase E2 component (dihydrolipoamide acetyltransferase)